MLHHKWTGQICNGRPTLPLIVMGGMLIFMVESMNLNNQLPRAGLWINCRIWYHTADTDPSTWTNWSTATYNTDTDVGSNDEYNGIISGINSGTYYYTFRYKTGGCDYVYGGYNSGGGGFWNGTTNVNGVLTVTPEDATFSFATNNYCQSGTDPTPSLSGVTGGTFSAPAGLSINTSSGEIDLSASTPGTYSVTYETPNCFSSSNFTVTITPDEDGTFSYSTTQFCTGGADPTPTISGTTGGSFSSGSGLSIDASTGVIDLSASTAGSYRFLFNFK